jgi:predicted RNase H-like HicB family nuclease/predicted RNA binding protein YcfA (HicA-like mRNA interferase family)
LKVKEVIKRIQDDGWYLVRTRGSHRQFHHPTKLGTVTVAGKESIDMPPGTLNSVLKTSWPEEIGAFMRYMVVIEKGETSWGAYVPDLPGCVAVGETEAEVKQLIQEAIEFHLEDLNESGAQIPAPMSRSEYVEVLAA